MRRVDRKKENKGHPLGFIFNPKLLALLGVIVLVAISMPLAQSLEQKNKVEKEVSSIKQEIQQLKSRNKELDKLVEYLDSDQFIEEQARTNFDMKEKGEEVVIVKKEAKVAGASTSAKEQGRDASSKARSNPAKWVSYFFEK